MLRKRRIEGNERVERSVKHGICEDTLEHWSGFVELIRGEHANCPAFIYRGQAHADWKVLSTLDRLEKRFPKKKNYSGENPLYFECSPASRQDHRNAFVEVARGKRGPNAPELSEDEWWALAQHHGLPTPMLDWTYYPFVALFFAFEEERVLVEKNLVEPEHRAVFTLAPHLLKEQHAESDPAPYPFSPRGESSHRLTSQGGLFLRMPESPNGSVDLEGWISTRFPDESGGSAVNRPPARTVLQKIVIPNRDRLDCLKLLNKMNVNRMTLFPDLDGAARYVKALWELDFDTSLGRFLGGGVTRRA